jgi:hypothetical protein
MRTLSKLILTCSVQFILNLSCRPANPIEASIKAVDTLNYVNLTILLDLSDRNLADGNDSVLDPDQIQRDTSIIQEILVRFSEKVRSNGYMYSKDRIQILIAPQADNKSIAFNPNIDIEELSKSNKVVRQVLPQLITVFTKQVNDIYMSHPKFTGADFWTFFRDYPAPDFIKQSSLEDGDQRNTYYHYENKMIILTDGYMVFDNSIQIIRAKDRTCMQVGCLRNDLYWERDFPNYKMTPIHRKGFDNFEVMLLELNPINPQRNTRELAIIEKYWEDWFGEMGVKYISPHLSTEPLPLINGAIRDFVSE